MNTKLYTHSVGNIMATLYMTKTGRKNQISKYKKIAQEKWRTKFHVTVTPVYDRKEMTQGKSSS